MSGDVVNPTISEMDKYDVKWGLTPRQSKGSTRKSLPTQSQLNMPAPVSEPAYTPAPAPAPAPAAAAPAIQPTPITVDPSKINTLR